MKGENHRPMTANENLAEAWVVVAEHARFVLERQGEPKMNRRILFLIAATLLVRVAVFGAEDFPKPYSPPCTERENVFEFTQKPQCRFIGEDKYEISFAVKGFCDVTVGIIDPSTDSGGDEKGFVVCHLASGVLGANAPSPFPKNNLSQKTYGPSWK
jgi:hypothetical protein